MKIYKVSKAEISNSSKSDRPGGLNPETGLLNIGYTGFDSEGRKIVNIDGFERYYPENLQFEIASNLETWPKTKNQINYEKQQEERARIRREQYIIEIERERERRKKEEEERNRLIKQIWIDLDINRFADKQHPKYDEGEGILFFKKNDVEKIIYLILQYLFKDQFTEKFVYEENVEAQEDFGETFSILEEKQTLQEIISEFLKESLHYSPYLNFDENYITNSSLEEIIDFILGDKHENIEDAINGMMYSDDRSRIYFTEQHFEAKKKKEYDEDVKVFEAEEDKYYKQLAEFAKSRGLTEEEAEEIIAQRSYIEDEGAWDPDLASSYKNWVRDNPFHTSRERQGFFTTFYKNSDYYYEDEEQEYQYWEFKRKEQEERKMEEDQFRKYKSEDQRRKETEEEQKKEEQRRKEREEQRRQRALESKEWKTIDDMLAFAEKHGIDLGELDKSDIIESCKKIYRKLASYFHPDKNRNRKEWAEENFKILGNLWENFKLINHISDSYMNWYKTSKVSMRS